MKRILLLLAGMLLLAASAPAATIVIVNNDGPNEGFNDPTPATPVGGNPGLTIGEQRLNLFQRAADIWGGILDSNVTIRVRAAFDPLSCSAGGGVLGGAAAIAVESDFFGAEWLDTWYHIALANKRGDTDLDPGGDDIRATFNSSIDNNDNCLSGRNWYYGFDGNEGTDVELLPVLLHELGHGLGFSNFVSLSTGSELLGLPDIYERHILDNTTGLHWNEMTASQRAASAVNTGNVVWDGPAVTGASAFFLSGAPALFTNAPPSLPATMVLGTASFGPPLTGAGVTGDVVLGDDGTGAVTDACTGLINGAQVAGKIALVDRGSCTFTTKAVNAQAAGAIAVIIVDNTGAATPPLLGGTAPSVTIPVVSVTTADGNLLKAELGNGLNVTLAPDGASSAGTDAQGRVKLYAPNPLQLGSSISHFDVSATPNLLMEPAITGSLHDTIDLTFQHFDDLGWFDPRVSAADDTPLRTTRLAANYPNPFNPSTRIDFTLSRSGPVKLEIFDARGRLVRRLVDGPLAADDHSVVWNGRDDRDRPVESGVYVYRLTGGDFQESRRMVLLK